MDTKVILNEIDAEISRLQQVRSLLAGAVAISTATKKRGRPVGSVAPASAPATARVKRTLSAEARARIAAAQTLRWAKSRQAAKKAARAAPKKSVPAKAAKPAPAKKAEAAAKKQTPVKAPEPVTA